MNRMLLAMGVLVGSVIAAPTAQEIAPIPSGQMVSELETLDRGFESAWLHRDAAFFRAVLADDMRFTHGPGNVQNKTEFLHALDTAGFLARDLISVEVEPHGEVATTIGRVHVRGSRAEYTISYVRLYARRGGKWQLLSHRTIGRVDGPLTNTAENH